MEAKQKWQSFIDWISNCSEGFVFRGVSNKEYLLIPSIGRLENYCFPNEINLFEQFKMRAKAHISASNDCEWLAIAQHHGLPTRLLDWTENPLIACFFAVVSNKEKDGRIYFTKFDQNRVIDINSNADPFAEPHISFYFPNIITSRIALQKGLFTIHPKPNVPVVVATPHRKNRYTLIDINQIYDYTEDLDTSIRYYVQPKDGEESDFEYQEKYYNLYSGMPLTFNIEAQYKDYFESQIRLLGIDETIFGDIDSIVKKLKNDLKKNRLHSIFYKSDIQEIITLITNELKLNPQYYFGSGHRKYSIVRSSIIIYDYKKAENDSYIFNGAVEIHPNYFDIDEGSWSVTPEQSAMIKKFYIILSEIVKDRSILCNSQDAFLLYFKIDSYEEGNYLNHQMVEIVQERDWKWERIEMYYKLFKKYEDILNNNEKEKQIIKDFDFTSSKFDKYILGEKFLKIFQPLLAEYHLNKK